MAAFAIAGETMHRVGDGRCPGCLDDYPGSCGCGGLIHAEAAGPEDDDGNVWVRTRCDRCHRAVEELDEDLGRLPPVQ